MPQGFWKNTFARFRNNEIKKYVVVDTRSERDAVLN